MERKFPFLIMGFQQIDRMNNQEKSNDNFVTPAFIKSQCMIGTENYPEVGIICKYKKCKYSQAYKEDASCFR